MVENKNKKPEPDFNGSKPAGMVQRITDFFKDAVYDGVILPVPKMTVTAEPEREPDKKSPDGKIIRGAMKLNENGNVIRPYEPQTISCKVDVTGCPQTFILYGFLQWFIVQYGKALKSTGKIETVRDADGKTVFARDHMTTGKKSVPDMQKAIRATAKMSKADILSLIEKLQKQVE
jgi:hypothetical protein